MREQASFLELFKKIPRLSVGAFGMIAVMVIAAVCLAAFGY